MSIAVLRCESDIWMSPDDQLDALIALETYERKRLTQRQRTPVAAYDGQAEVLGAQTLAEALAAFHLSATLDDTGALVALENSCGNFHAHLLELFTVLAPSVRPGSTITWRVEDASGTHDAYEYRWTFTAGAVQEQVTATGTRQATPPAGGQRRRRGHNHHTHR